MILMIVGFWATNTVPLPATGTIFATAGVPPTTTAASSTTVGAPAVGTTAAKKSSAAKSDGGISAVWVCVVAISFAMAVGFF